MDLPISEILISNKRRPLKEETVVVLMESIKEVGLLNPIVVTKDRWLVAGLHRYEACDRLGWDKIPCSIIKTSDALKIELAEIDENLMRNDLSPNERRECLVRRKEIYEEKHPETKSVQEKGGPGRGKKNKPHGEASFVRDTAAKTGRSKASIERDIQIAKNLVPEVKDAVADTKLEGSTNTLLEISRIPVEEQKKVAKDIVASKKNGAGAKVKWKSSRYDYSTTLNRLEKYLDKLTVEYRGPTALLVGVLRDCINNIEEKNVEL